MGDLSKVIIAVPCYNEAARLDTAALAPIFADERVELVLVDDGSSDGTEAILRRFADGHERAHVLSLAKNVGKGEAVRAGMRYGIEQGADAVGYFDADMATPAEEVLRLLAALEDSDTSAVIGSRIATLGANIDRTLRRHLLGRVFATAASLILGEMVYDTQCGAKLFRTGDALARSLDEPFASRWAFDVELLGRLLIHGGTIIEVGLHRWREVRGSKMSLVSMGQSGLELVRVHGRLRALRAKLGK